jgi:hypothetical protein
MGICITAIANAAEQVGGKPTREDVMEAMENLEAYDGITGSYEFNDEGDPVEGVYYVLQANADDWNANDLAARLVIAPPSDEAEGDEEAEEPVEEGTVEAELPEDATEEEAPAEDGATEEEAPAEDGATEEETP